MDIGEIVSDAIKYPSQKWGKIIILGIILIIPIVNFIGLGYLFRVLKATFAGIDDVPEFDEAGELFIDGLKILVVGIVYAIPVFIIGAIISLIFGVSAGSTVSSFDMFAILAGSLVYVILAIIIGLIESIAIANMALYEGELGAAFKFSEVMDRISAIGWGKYIIWYIVMILIGIIAYLVAAGISILTFGIGIILVILVIAPYISVFGARSLALLFASSEEDQQAP
ncbi:MAG: DUF4013 domain-containing protein [Methanobacterium sp.]|nr:MAG: DUF4013 domain-containing protein [Methanobacterium sp.]